MKIYYISDLHLGDFKVLAKCQRPFKTTQECEQAILTNWNSVVTDEDMVYIVGDICFDEYIQGLEIIKQCKGHKHLIVGNHDWKLLSQYRKSGVFESINNMKMIKDKGKNVFLCHYPTMDWPDFNRGGYHVYGHIHNRRLPDIKTYYKNHRAFNASCDVIGFTPRTLEELMALKEANKDKPYVN